MRRTNDVDVEVLMNAQLMDEYVPEPEPEPSRWARSATHFFRTDPGNRSRMIRIPRPPLNHPNDPDEKKLAFYRRQFERKYTLAERERFDAIIEANHDDPYIRFVPIPNRFEGFFETESNLVADYIDELIAKGDLPFAYRDSARPNEVVTTMPTHRAAAAHRVAVAQGAET